MVGGLLASARSARDALTQARAAVRRGAVLSAALSAANLPPLTREMIRDGEQANRLWPALAVVADYLLDEATATAGCARRREV